MSHFDPLSQLSFYRAMRRVGGGGGGGGGWGGGGGGGRGRCLSTPYLSTPCLIDFWHKFPQFQFSYLGISILNIPYPVNFPSSIPYPVNVLPRYYVS